MNINYYGKIKKILFLFIIISFYFAHQKCELAHRLADQLAGQDRPGK